MLIGGRVFAVIYTTFTPEKQNIETMLSPPKIRGHVKQWKTRAVEGVGPSVPH